MTRQDFINMGFEELPHYTVTGSLIYKLDRKRHLSVGSAGTPNEMIFICQMDDNDDKKITDLVCLHNYDHDGFMCEDKLKSLIFGITGECIL